MVYVFFSGMYSVSDRDVMPHNFLLSLFITSKANWIRSKLMVLFPLWVGSWYSNVEKHKEKEECVWTLSQKLWICRALCVKKVANKIIKHFRILPRLKVNSKLRWNQFRKDISVIATTSDLQETFNSPWSSTKFYIWTDAFIETIAITVIPVQRFCYFKLQ